VYKTNHKAMAKKQVHVVPHLEGWAVKTSGSDKAFKVVDTQSQAIKIGKEVAKNNATELLIHGTNGKIREKNTYGPDSYPPKG